jgi:hypothetical protein
MKKLFLLTLILALFCTLVIGASSAGATKNSVGTSEEVSKVKVKKPSPVVRYDGSEPLREQDKPVILLPAWLSDGEAMTGWEKKPVSGKPNVPDQNIILQGGDDIGSATEIASLPYSTTGTTEGYTDDYDESCPDPSTSPDVVYSYAPAGAETVDIYVWGYDTKLFVYENDEGTLVDCNDDFFYYGQSALQDLALTGGNTYYIVVDGWGGDFGDYVFEMMNSPARPVGNFCADAEHNTLVSGVNYVYNNDSRYCLDTDDWFPGPEVFISFTVPFEMDVTLDMCGTNCDGNRWGISWLNLAQPCPLEENTASADEYDRDSCDPDDDNLTQTWLNVPAGTYYYPVFSLPEVPSNGFCCWGPFTVNVVGYGCAEDEIKIEILTDNYPEETTWEVYDVLADPPLLVGSGGPYDGYPNTLFRDYICVPPGGCYEFTIYDVFGDGICCDYGEGYYNIYYNDQVVATGGEFGSSETVTGIGDGCIGACCVDGVCEVTNTEDECNLLGGEWFLGEECPGFECPAPTLGACCHDGTCEDLTYASCTGVGGYWHPLEECASYECLDVLYHEDFNNGMGDWVSEPSWGITFSESNTPPSCMTDSPGGNYGNNENNPVELTIDIPLTGYVGYAVSFATKFQIETGFDYVYMEISDDGGTNWDPLYTFNGELPEQYEWHNFTADISGYFDESVRFKFTLESDGAYIVDGMYVDDFYVYGLTEDNSPPLIMHTGPTPETSVPDEFTAVATIVDPSGIASAELTYTVDGGGETTIGPDDVIGDVYTFIIPVQEAGARVRYIILAEDNSGNSGSIAEQHYVSGTIIMYDDNDPEYIYSFDENGGDRIATRFTPPQQAVLVTGMLRLYVDVNRNPEFVDAEVWDNGVGDVPDQSLTGLIETWPEADLEHPQAWTYVDLRGMDLTFNAFEDFHFGCGFRDSVPPILYDTPAVTDRSKISEQGGTWGPIAGDGSDWHIRVVVDLLGGAACDYVAGDANENGSPLELGDVVQMIAYYRGTASPTYFCECGANPSYPPNASQDGNCSPFELGDVVTQICAYRGTCTAQGCPDCPPPGIAPDGGITPTLKSKVKIIEKSSD